MFLYETFKEIFKTMVIVAIGCTNNYIESQFAPMPKLSIIEAWIS